MIMKIACPPRVGELIKIALPCFAEQILLVIAGIVSTSIVGQLGKYELTAATMSNSFVNWLQCAYTGLSTGATVVVARMWGSGDREGTQKAFLQAVKMVVVVSLCVLLLTIVFKNAIIKLFCSGAEPEVIENIHIYFTYCMLGMPATAIANMICASLRGIGDNKTALYTTTCVNVFNLLFSFMFVFGVEPLGIPRMGVMGAGIAIVIARYLTMVLTIIYIFISKKPVLPKKYIFGFDWAVLKRVTNIGTPTAMEQFIFNGGFVILQTLLIGFGTLFQAGYQIGANFNGIGTATSNAMSVAIMSLISRALGKNDWELAKQYVAATKFIIWTAFSAICVIMLAISPLMANVYSNDPQVVEQGTYFCMMFSVMIIPVGYFQAMSGVLRGAGDAKYVAFTSIFALWFMRIFGVWLLARLTNNGYIAVTVGVGLDFVTRAVLYHFRVKKGNWLHIRV